MNRLQRELKINIYDISKLLWSQIKAVRIKDFLDNELTENFFYNLMRIVNKQINDADFLFFDDFICIKLDIHFILFFKNNTYIAIRVRNFKNVYGVCELKYSSDTYTVCPVNDTILFKKLAEKITPDFIFVPKFTDIKIKNQNWIDLENIINNKYANRINILKALIYTDDTSKKTNK